MSNITNLESINTTLSEMDGKYLTFFTDNQLFGVPICDVVQIVGMQEITTIPEYPDYAKGIINLRGSIIPVIDIRLRFLKPEIPYDERTCIIVTTINDMSIGFIVDAVDAVTDIDIDNISEPPHLSSNDSSPYLTGIAKHEGKVVLLMDTAKILTLDIIQALATENN